MTDPHRFPGSLHAVPVSLLALALVVSGCGDAGMRGNSADAGTADAADRQYRLALATPGVTASRQLLVAAAEAGSLPAATRMVQLAMWDEMGAIDPHQPPVSLWAATATVRMTGSARPSMVGHGPGIPAVLPAAIVAAEFRANWATRHREAADWQTLMANARAVLVDQGWDCGEPIVLGETAWLCQDVAPAEHAEASVAQQRLAARFTAEDFVAWDDRQHAQAIAEYLDRLGDQATRIAWWARAVDLATAEGRTAVEALCMDDLSQSQGRPGSTTDWAPHIAAHAGAADLAHRAGDPWVEGESLRMEAWAMQPDNNPGGDWARAAALDAQAAQLFDRSGDLDRESSCLMWQAWCLHADHNPNGDWTRAGALHAQAAQVAAQAGDAKELAYNLSWQAFCVTPETNPPGSWAAAAKLYAQAAALEQQTGDRPDEADSLAKEAYCLSPEHDRAGDWATVVALYSQAAGLLAGTGDRLGQARDLMWEAISLRPDNNRVSGDVGRAAALYGQAADVIADGDWQTLEHAVAGQAWCTEPDHNPAGDWKTALALYVRAGAIATKVGDGQGIGQSLMWQAWCLQPDHNPAGDWTRAEQNLVQAAGIFKLLGDHRQEAACLSGEASCLMSPANPQRDVAAAQRLYAQAAALARQVPPGGGAGGQNPALLY